MHVCACMATIKELGLLVKGSLKMIDSCSEIPDCSTAEQFLVTDYGESRTVTVTWMDGWMDG